MKNISLLFFSIILCLSSNTIALNIEDNCEVKIGNFDWDSSLIHSQIIKKIIEYGYNCKGEILEIDNKNVFKVLNDNHINIVMENWSDSNNITNDKIINLGPSSNAYDQILYIDKKTSNKFNIKSIDDLKILENSQYFMHNNKTNKGIIFTCNENYNCYWLNKAKMLTYSIDKYFDTENFEDHLLLNKKIKEHLDKNLPILFFYNEPSSLIGKYVSQINVIKEPEFNELCNNQIIELIENIKLNKLLNINSKKYCASKAKKIDLIKLSTKDWIKNNAEIGSFINQYFLSLSDVNNLLYNYIYKFNGDINITTNYFLQNNNSWHNWVSIDAKDKIILKLND